eukprot:TRINITY_DN23170_c0_g1_i1.p1 TRINITY_DN23170_c0_g1~~TRINITY_DN23170_c0_g1_i1.p1  ORF type:complete len:298 (-),score=30.77 TRINITY_DN23170_c0_g1_i1:39-932(-)
MCIRDRLGDSDSLHMILQHSSLEAWQNLTRSCSNLEQHLRNSVLWGERRMPSRNGAVRAHLAQRFQQISRQAAELYLEEGGESTTIELSIEGVKGGIGTTSLVNSFCGARTESIGEVRKRYAFLMSEGKLIQVLVKEKKCSGRPEGPLCGAFYTKVSTAMIAIDLASGEEQLRLAASKLRFLASHGAQDVPKVLVGTRRDLRCRIDNPSNPISMISYDAIADFCQKHNLVFADTSACDLICGVEPEHVPEDLVACSFERELANGGIVMQHVDLPFRLGVLMALEPAFTQSMVHPCCL